jgi:hypothetical protein
MRVLVCVVLLACHAFSQSRSFSDTLYPVFKDAGCPACHNTNGVASATRLQFPDARASVSQVEAFGKSLVRLVDREHPSESLLLQKPTLRIPHVGGRRIQPGSPEEARLIAWIEMLAALNGRELAAALGSTNESPQPAGTPTAALRRLTHSQYNNTVRDLLGDRTAPANQFPSDDFVNGFKDQYDGQSFSPLLAEAYGNAAEKLARNAFLAGDHKGLTACQPSSPSCADEFIRTFGLRAFRRPLEASEVRRYKKLCDHERDFPKGAQLVVETMLQSPNFLFRLEEASEPQWKPFATASRLSYALWDTMPDARLLEAASRGELETPAAIESTVRRMLQDPRAHQALDEFVAEWLRFDRVLTSTRDRRRYRNFTRETAIAMTEEARRFVGDLVWNGRNFMDAFTAGYGFVNVDLAAIYGVAPPATEFERVSFPPDSERAGLLGQALFLALAAKPDDTSLTGRGLFVREQFLCQHVPPPPAGVNTNLAPSTEAHPQTNRQRMSEHVENKSCATCHNLIDPIGFGFEKFDAVGARREQYELLFRTGYHDDRKHEPKKVLLTMDTKGWVAGLPQSDFTSPRELGAVLAGSPQCQECIVKQYFRYIAGRAETPADTQLIRKVTEDFRGSGFQFKELIVSLIRHREFPKAERNVHVAGNH